MKKLISSLILVLFILCGALCGCAPTRTRISDNPLYSNVTDGVPEPLPQEKMDEIITAGKTRGEENRKTTLPEPWPSFD